MVKQLVSSAEAQEIAAQVREQVRLASIEAREISRRINAAAEVRVNKILAERKARPKKCLLWIRFYYFD
jgi:hypothetical protein